MRFQDLYELIPSVGLIQAAMLEKLREGGALGADVIENQRL